MKKIHVAIVMAAEAVLLCAGVAIAARNSSGTMVAINGPYTAGSVISSSVINARLADIENELTNSVDKGGRTVMTAPLPLSNGTFALPSLTFGTDTDTGIYRIGANNLGVTAGGGKVLDVATTGLGVTGTLAVSSTTALSDTLAIAKSGTAAANAATFFEASLANGNSLALRLGKADTGASDGVGIYYTANATAANSKGCVAVSGQTDTLCVDGNGKVLVSGVSLTILGAGTGISASYRGTTSWTPGVIGTNACVTTTVSLTGAAAGADCTVTPPSGTPVASVWTSCSVTLNTCNLYQCNADNVNTHTGDVGTYACRVFNP
jgi:hypothetical protein